MCIFSGVAIAKELQDGESLLKCSFNPGEAKFPNGQTFQTEAYTFNFISNFDEGILKCESDQLPLQTTVRETEIEAVHYESNGNIFAYKINRLDGSAVYEYASPYGNNGSGEMTYATSLALGECKKLDPTKKLF